MIRATCLSSLVVATLGCGSDAETTTVERTTAGDTAVVRTVAGSRWGDSVRLMEELRVGSLDGAVELQFSRIDGFALDPDGGFVVFDASVPALRQFDAHGAFVRTLGRNGSGPGEYGDNLGVLVAKDGTILQYDIQNSRINRYTADGTPLDAWPVSSQLYTGDAFVMDTAGALYYKFLLEEPRPDEEWDIGYQRLTPDGAVSDTVRVPYPLGPEAPGRTNLHPSKFWNLGRLGYRLMGHTSNYAITLLRPEGPLRIERAIAATPWHPELRAQLLARFNQPRAGQPAGPRIDLPQEMPAFVSAQQMRDGRIWVMLYDSTEAIPEADVPSDPNRSDAPVITWRRVAAWDVFEEDGTFLGRIRFPGRSYVLDAIGDTVWVLERGEVDEQYVVRYRMVAGS